MFLPRFHTHTHKIMSFTFSSGTSLIFSHYTIPKLSLSCLYLNMCQHFGYYRISFSGRSPSQSFLGGFCVECWLRGAIWGLPLPSSGGSLCLLCVCMWWIFYFLDLILSLFLSSFPELLEKGNMKGELLEMKTFSTNHIPSMWLIKHLLYNSKLIIFFYQNIEDISIVFQFSVLLLNSQYDYYFESFIFEFFQHRSFLFSIF